MPAEQTVSTESEASKMERKNSYRTLRVRRIAKVAGDDKKLKAELARLALKALRRGIGRFGDHINFGEPNSVDMLNEHLRDFINCAYLGIVHAERINESKEKILTLDLMMGRSVNEALSKKASDLVNQAIDEAIVKVVNEFHNPEYHLIYCYDGKEEFSKEKKLTPKEFFELYKERMDVNEASPNSQDLVSVTCRNLHVYRSDVIFNRYKNYLLKLVQEAQFKKYESAVKNMIEEFNFKNRLHAEPIIPECITIFANAIKLLKSSVKLNHQQDQENIQEALKNYNASVEAFKKSPDMVSNQRRGRLIACAALAILVTTIVTITLIAMLATNPIGWAALAGLLLLLPLTSSITGAVMEALPRKSPSSIHSLKSRFKHTTLFSKVFEGEVAPAKSKSPSASLLIA